MTRNERYMYQAYLLLLRRTIELLDEQTLFILESDRKWRFYRDIADQYRERSLTETQPNYSEFPPQRAFL